MQNAVYFRQIDTMKLSSFLLLAAFLFAGCGGSENPSLNEAEINSEMGELLVDSNVSIGDDFYVEETGEEEGKNLVDDGSAQMGFCECVKKLKALEDKMLETESDDEFAALELEMDLVLKENCRVLAEDDQADPEARAERQARIKACLN